MSTQLELVHVAPPRDGSPPRADHAVIAQLVDEGARVLDVGCGDGALMRLLARECKARVSGLERDVSLVRHCVGRGLTVAQGDAERDLAQFPSGGFDVVILSHTLQHVADPRTALKQAARIGARVIVTIRNAGHWRRRAGLMFGGRVAAWDGPRHAASVRDLAELARAQQLAIETAVPVSGGQAGAPFAKTIWRANWFAEEAVFLLAN
jgi:methionine biosynthesis protein MetW